MSRLSVQGKFIYEEGRRVFARGVSYGPFRPNSRGESYPEIDRVAADFALMRELGANLVRTYIVPPPWLFEQALSHGLRVMVGIPWPFQLAFLDSRQMEREIRATIRREVASLRQFGEAIFAYSLGNEIRSDIVRWHGPRAVSRFLAELYDVGKQLDAEGLFTYSNYPSVEYLDLSFLDVVSFNVYLHRESDFRRYLTHLLALSAELPLILSETGVDTIREGADYQAQLLGWQARAAFELGCSGMVVFAFTDEWFTGGNEIGDWAFGITTRERNPKPAFAAVAQVFTGSLPPPLRAAPRATVIVATYNGARTLARCLESLKRLNYPDYELLVVDDGSTDATAAIAQAAGVPTLRLSHRGLAAARNAGLAAASGSLVAFIDADAEADSDWLYHLAATIRRADAVAAGGQNLAPVAACAFAEAVAAAPGQPREVRSGDDELAQLCGCSMAVDKSRLGPEPAFDPVFTAAGDDVDLSWRLRDAGFALAYAPGAVVIHQRRATIAAYLKQQQGYGYAEGLLLRKYPHRRADAEGVYGGSKWPARWLGAGSRIYRGRFGRGLFQTVYPGSSLPLAAQLPLTIQWTGSAILLTSSGAFDRLYGVLGIAGLLTTLGCACAGATMTRRDQRTALMPNRPVLVALWLLGPLVRSWARECVKWSFRPETSGAPTPQASGLSGKIALPMAATPPLDAEAALTAGEALLDALQLALVRRGLAVARGTSFDPFDLQIIVAPCLRVALVLLSDGGPQLIAWRTTLAWRRAVLCLLALACLLLIGGFSLAAVAAIVGLACLTTGIFASRRARRIPALISAAWAELVRQTSTVSQTRTVGTAA